MAECETGETHSEFPAAVLAAAAHWFANARIPMDTAQSMESVALMSFDLQRIVEQLDVGTEDDPADAIHCTVGAHPLPVGSLAAAAQTFRNAVVECVANAPVEEPEEESLPAGCQQPLDRQAVYCL